MSVLKAMSRLPRGKYAVCDVIPVESRVPRLVSDLKAAKFASSRFRWETHVTKDKMTTTCWRVFFLPEKHPARGPEGVKPFGGGQGSQPQTL
jgi:hypothetical protein